MLSNSVIFSLIQMNGLVLSETTPSTQPESSRFLNRVHSVHFFQWLFLSIPNNIEKSALLYIREQKGERMRLEGKDMGKMEGGGKTKEGGEKSSENPSYTYPQPLLLPKAHIFHTTCLQDKFQVKNCCPPELL